jgi:hypothetical protein
VRWAAREYAGGDEEAFDEARVVVEAAFDDPSFLDAAEASKLIAAVERALGKIGGAGAKPMTERQREYVRDLWERLLKAAVERGGEEGAEDRALGAAAAALLKVRGIEATTENVEECREVVKRVLAGRASAEEASEVIDALSQLVGGRRVRR